MEIWVTNTLSGLKPMYGTDYDNKKKLKVGQDYLVTVKMPRNLKFHRKMFALYNLVFQNQEYLKTKTKEFLQKNKIKMKLTKEQVSALAVKNGYTYNNLNAVIKVESGGVGFATDTGKIIIQFEPSWFKRKSPYTPSGKWSLNKVESQSKEWIAFNDAFKLNPNAAMESTSIGLMQVMGFHYKTLGFKTVGEMWDFAKVSEANQLEIAIRFIKSIPKLDKALKQGDAETFAFYYNGSQYKKFNYDKRLIDAGMKKV